MAEKCGWCDEPAVTNVVTVKGKKNRKTAPVCEEHAERFERAGQMTDRLEALEKSQKSISPKTRNAMRTWGPS